MCGDEYVKNVCVCVCACLPACVVEWGGGGGGGRTHALLFCCLNIKLSETQTIRETGNSNENDSHATKYTNVQLHRVLYLITMR